MAGLPPVTAIVIGAGNRGKTYASYALDCPDKLRIVGVAEPRPIRRESVQSLYNIPASEVFLDWRQAAERPRFADVAFVCTQDRDHVEPAVAFARLGYHLLLEKPMAVTDADCEAITRACEESGVMLCVGHVLRYTPANRKIKELIVSGAIGDVVTIQHTEPVGFYHFAHSFVRGNWRREDESTFSLLAKSCHDVDLIRYWMGVPCMRVSSFGSLKHFTKANKPQGASSRCLDCAVEKSCPYSAKKIYLDRVTAGHTGWPLNAVSDIIDVENITAALTTGPYGRCAYECDNDVCDNQIVNFEFEGGRTATFNMIAFTEKLCVRTTRVFGTRGELFCDDGDTVHHFDFLTQTKTHHHSHHPANTRLVGHGGADYYLICSFIDAIQQKNPALVATSAQDALASHRLVFVAEEARRKGQILTV